MSRGLVLLNELKFPFWLILNYNWLLKWEDHNQETDNSEVEEKLRELQSEITQVGKNYQQLQNDLQVKPKNIKVHVKHAQWASLMASSGNVIMVWTNLNGGLQYASLKLFGRFFITWYSQHLLSSFMKHTKAKLLSKFGFLLQLIWL